MTLTVLCDCERAEYDADRHNSCYQCFLDRIGDLVSCIWCGRLHGHQYATCFKCRQIPGRDEAGKVLRLEILIRDGAACRYCGTTDGAMQIDHIKPCAKGGTIDPWNLQTLCAQCNRHKGSTWVKSWSRFCQHALARQEMVEAYWTYLWQYLTAEQKERLTREVEDWLGADELWRPATDQMRRAA